MLQIRQSCENCAAALPADSTAARICSYECTFCANCVDGALANVCPNCGGGFTPRPIRPARNWKNDNFLGTDPVSLYAPFRPVDPAAHALFAARIAGIPPQDR